MENKPQKIEIGDIFRQYAPSFLSKHKLSPNQLDAFNAIMNCRTEALGGHQSVCSNCQYQKQSYNSCRNRHCPKCQFIKKAQWVDKLAGNLPPVKHFHLVFTIPNCLHKLFYINQKEAYSLLFKAAGEALKKCTSNYNYLGAETGAVAILHTWGQTLSYHPHLHFIVPAGGLSEDLREWIPSSNKFLLPVTVLSTVFRGILCDLLEKNINNNTLKLPYNVTNFKALKDQCYKTKWVVYSEKPFNSPKNLINYLGNYTHRVAISNHRLIACKDDKVTFRYKDYKTGGVKKTMTLDVDEFIRRFLQHILPSGFSKIRYFGFMALRSLKVKLNACFNLIKKATYLPSLEGLNAAEVLSIILDKDPFCCPKCKNGRLFSKLKILHLHPI
jgi:hypothetical protein